MTMDRMSMILYLHGFRSSPSSFKARMMAAEMARLGCPDQWRCPALPVSPRAAIDMALEQANQLGRQHGKDLADSLTVVGSSLGGYYAMHVAEKLGCRAVLLNPAVHADRDLARRVGTHTNYHNQEQIIEFLPHYLTELASLKSIPLTRPERYLLIAATGDELLDWREMRDICKGAKQIIIEGSDHGISDFATWMPEVMRFAGYDDTRLAGQQALEAKNDLASQSGMARAADSNHKMGRA